MTQHRLATQVPSTPAGAFPTPAFHSLARRRLHRHRLAGAALLMAGAVALAACGSAATSSKTSSSKTSSSTASPPQSQPTARAAAAAYTVGTAKVGKLGTVLVNGAGRTLYLLDSEAGGKITCTDANGCTKIWPDIQLPAGVTHGIATGGAQASLLGTVKSADGSLYLTYGAQHWPLYTFSGDSGPGQANGEGIHSFGGAWWAISPAGDAVKAAAPSPSGSGGSTGNGY